MKSKFVQLVTHACHPINTMTSFVQFITHFHFNIRIPHHHLKWYVSGACMFGGSALAITSSGMAIPHAAHISMDVLAYFIHGVGSTPYLELVVRTMTKYFGE